MTDKLTAIDVWGNTSPLRQPQIRCHIRKNPPLTQMNPVHSQFS